MALLRLLSKQEKEQNMAVVTSLAERLDIVESSTAGEAAWRISQRLGWRQSAIRKWRNRGRKLDRAGLVSRMGRPAKGALSSFPEEISTTLLRWRHEHPGWGPITLCKELAQYPALAGRNVPSSASIGPEPPHLGETRPDSTADNADSSASRLDVPSRRPAWAANHGLAVCPQPQPGPPLRKVAGNGYKPGDGAGQLHRVSPASQGYDPHALAARQAAYRFWLVGFWYACSFGFCLDSVASESCGCLDPVVRSIVESFVQQPSVSPLIGEPFPGVPDFPAATVQLVRTKLS